MQDWGYSLFNIVQVDTIQPALFVQGGQTWWAWDEQIAFDNLKAEVGIETHVTLTLSPLAIAITVGYAYPISGTETSAQGAVFIDFTTSF